MLDKITHFKNDTLSFSPIKNKYTIIRPPITMYGGKYRACKEIGIYEYIPPLTNNKQAYIEPFIGSGVMLFNLPYVRTAILNDKYDMIWNFFYILRTKSLYEQFITELKYIWIGKTYFEEFKIRTDPVGKAIFFYLMNRSSHKGIMESTFRYKPFNHPFEKDFSIWTKKFNDLASLTFWNLDFHQLYEKLMNNGTEQYGFVWEIDSPYYHEDRYIINFTDQDHLDLFNYHTQLKNNPYHHLIIHYNNCEYIRKLYHDWYIKPVQWTQSSRDTNIIKTELLISNRPIQRYLINSNRTVSNPKNMQSNFNNLVIKS